jgi:hypothetical protein
MKKAFRDALNIAHVDREALAVVDTMARLHCRRVAESTYSHDSAICDLCLFRRLRERLLGVTVVNTNDLGNDAMSILTSTSDLLLDPLHPVPSSPTAQNQTESRCANLKPI